MRYSSVTAKPQDWLPGYEDALPVGLAVLVGAAGAGKGTLIGRIVGDVTNGAHADPRTVIMVGAEDDPETCVIHRLLASGADVERVEDMTWLGAHADEHPHHLSTEGKCECDLFTIGGPNSSLEALERKIKATNAGLVVLDPLNALAGVTLKHDRIVRRDVMEPLQAIAKRCHTSILLVHHFNKAGTVAGSQGIVDAARHVLEIRRANTLRQCRIFKTNLTDDDADLFDYYIIGQKPAITVRFVGNEKLADIKAREAKAREGIDRLRSTDQGTPSRSLMDILGRQD
jgi:predicted ATP-dependent serine protease